MRYFLSAGYDKDLNHERGNGYDRVTLKSDNTFRIAPGLNIHAAMSNSWSRHTRDGMGLSGFKGEVAEAFYYTSVSQYALYPYQKLKDSDGNAVAAPRGFESSYIDYLKNLGFQDWTYRPLDELRFNDNTSKQNNTRITAGIDYKLTDALSVDLKYQMERQFTLDREVYHLGSYYARDLFNQFTKITADSTAVSQIPIGDILDVSDKTLVNNQGRAELRYNKSWLGEKHSFAGIAGTEIRDIRLEGRGNRYYGYDNHTLSFVDVDYTKAYTLFPKGHSQAIPGWRGQQDSITAIRDRYVSYYANAAYSFLERYVVSASARIDKSNLFGAERKDRNAPLWSAGAAWSIDRESFFTSHTISNLRLRATYGFNGNIDKTQTRFPIANVFRDFLTGRRVASIASPANSLLQWEKVKMTNVGLDFALRKNIFWGVLNGMKKKESVYWVITPLIRPPVFQRSAQMSLQ